MFYRLLQIISNTIDLNELYSFDALIEHLNKYESLEANMIRTLIDMNVDFDYEGLCKYATENSYDGSYVSDDTLDFMIKNQIGKQRIRRKSSSSD